MGNLHLFLQAWVNGLDLGCPVCFSFCDTSQPVPVKQKLREKSSRNSRWRGECYNDNLSHCSPAALVLKDMPLLNLTAKHERHHAKENVLFITIKDAFSDPVKWISHLKTIKDRPAMHSRICPYITPTSGTAISK